MIPDVKTILEMLEADQCSKGQALAWIEEHMKTERETYLPSLRDDFAASAMGDVLRSFNWTEEQITKGAEMCYRLADAMLVARSSISGDK